MNGTAIRIASHYLSARDHAATDESPDVQDVCRRRMRGAIRRAVMMGGETLAHFNRIIRADRLLAFDAEVERVRRAIPPVQSGLPDGYVGVERAAYMLDVVVPAEKALIGELCAIATLDRVRFPGFSRTRYLPWAEQVLSEAQR